MNGRATSPYKHCWESPTSTASIYPHNVAFYARSDDGRVAVLQNDWGFGFQLSSGASIYGVQNVYKMLRLPVYRRLYQGHLLDLMNSVYNSAYLTGGHSTIAT